MGGAVGVFCALTARHYDSLMGLGHRPDGTSLVAAMRVALSALFTPIIWADDALGSRLFLLGAGAASAVVLTGL